MIAVDLLAAAKAGDNDQFAVSDQKWEVSAHDIARFLAGANPHWPEEDTFDLLALHLKLTKASAVARLTGDWTADVKAFDDIFTEIIVVADTLSEGITKAFPEQF